MGKLIPNLLALILIFGCKTYRPATHQSLRTPDLLFVADPTATLTLDKRTTGGSYPVGTVNPRTGKIACFNWRDTTLYFYDWKQRQYVDSARLRYRMRCTKGFARNYTYYDDDSIFVTYQPDYSCNWRFDSLVVQFDVRGQLRQVLSIRDLPFSSHQFAELGKDSLLYFAVSRHQPVYGGGWLWLPVLRQNCKLGNDCYKTYRSPLVVAIDAQTGGRANAQIPLHYPEHAYDHFYPRDAQEVAAVVNHANRPVFVHGLSFDYTEYDPRTRQLRAVRVPSRFVDTLAPLYARRADGQLETGLDSEPREPELRQFYFDPYRKLYYRVIRLGTRGSTSFRALNSMTHALAVLDTNFRLVGEGILPPPLQPEEKQGVNVQFIMSPDGLFFVDRPATLADTTGHIHYVRYELKPGPLVAAPPPAPHREIEEDWTGLAAAGLGRKPGTEAVIVTPIDRSCPPCLAGMLESYPYFVRDREQRDSLGHDFPAVPLILLGRNEKRLRETIDQYRLDSLPTWPVHAHPFDLELDYVKKGFVNPRLLFFRKGKLYRRYELNPAEMQVLPVLLQDFYKGRELPKPEEL